MFTTNADSKCALDRDESYFTQTTTPATTTTATTTATSTSTSSESAKETIQMVTMPAYLFLDKTSPSNQTKDGAEVSELLASLSSKPVVQFDNQKLANNANNGNENGSFFSSIELKQTLMGSFIGALFVVIVVALLTLLIKTSRRKWLLGKNNASLCEHHDKDKSTNTTSTTTSANNSPYDLGKLSLQTLCVGNINSSGSSSSSSSASSSSRSSGGTTHTCACLEKGGDGATLTLQHQHNLQQNSCLFTKMDPLRLTMSTLANNSANSNPNRNSFHQNYLNCHLVNAQQPQNPLAAAYQYQFNASHFLNKENAENMPKK